MMDEAARRRRIDHKRSKQGCLTCRTRRKKCAEDFQRWQDGSWACSACHVRGQICRLPASTRGLAAHAHSSSMRSSSSSASASTSSASPMLRRRAVVSPSASPNNSQEAMAAVPTPRSDTLTAATANSSIVADTAMSESIPHFLPATSTTSTSTTIMQNGHKDATALDLPGGSWLDRFFDEFMELTGPQNHMSNGQTARRGAAGSAMDMVAPVDVSIPQGSNHHSTTEGAFDSLDLAIDRTVRSDDLDELLVRWSSIYETYLCAIFDTSKPAGDKPLMDRLMEITRTHTTCKASMVACCLAYRDVIERELQQSASRPPSRFVKYMISGGPSSLPSSNSASHFAHAWLRFAHDGFVRDRASMPIATKLLTLLNIRYASVCLLGARDSFALAPFIHAALTEVEVDVDYLYETYKCGTTLSFMVQALAYANAMDAATVRGARSAIRDHRRAASGTTILSRDSAVNPLADYCYVTMLSVGLLECIKRVSDLAADIDEGRVLLKTDVDARSSRIEDLIMTSDIDLPRDMCDVVARVRAFTLHEMWRQAVLLQLYQDVHRLGPVAKKVQRALSQILKLAELLPPTEREIDVWDMSMVWFLACTVAITESQRSICLGQLESLGCERAILDNVHAVKVIWRVMDETGRAVDWRDVLTEHNLTVCYTF